MAANPLRQSIDPAETTAWNGVERRRHLRRVDDARPAQARVRVPEMLPARDNVRWGPIWSGLLTAITMMMLLNLLGIGMGIGLGAARGGLALEPGAAFWAAAAGVVGFFVGGFVTGLGETTESRRWAAWNGAMVFFLAFPIALVFGGLGLGQLLGTFGSLPSALASSSVGPGVQPSAGAGGPTPADVEQAARWVVGGSLVALLAAAIGGVVGKAAQQSHREEVSA